MTDKKLNPEQEKRALVIHQNAVQYCNAMRTNLGDIWADTLLEMHRLMVCSHIANQPESVLNKYCLDMKKELKVLIKFMKEEKAQEKNKDEANPYEIGS